MSEAVIEQQVRNLIRLAIDTGMIIYRNADTKGSTDAKINEKVEQEVNFLFRYFKPYIREGTL